MDFVYDINNTWVSIQSIDINKANEVANEVMNFQGFLTQNQAIMCLGGASFDDVIDHDIRIWKPKTFDVTNWFYPI